MFNDLYFRINIYALKKEYSKQDIEGKKRIIEEGLKKYLEEKLAIPKNINFTVIELFSLLENGNIDKEDINIITSFILDTASNIQNKQIVWYGEFTDNPPLISFKEKVWDSLTTSELSSPTQILLFVYDIFINNFMSNNKTLVKKED